MQAELRHVRLIGWPLVMGAVLAAAVLTGRTADAQREPPRHTFIVEIEGLSAGPFREVAGISVETEVLEFRDGTSGEVRKLPGRTIWPNIELKRAFTGDRALFDWAMANAGSAARRSVSISVMDSNGAVVARWRFHNAWPAKYTAPILNASGNEVAIETIELAHEGFSRDDP